MDISSSSAAGRSFGELALINTDCVRNASIIADELTDLIVVNRDLYNRSLKVNTNNIIVATSKTNALIYDEQYIIITQETFSGKVK